MKMSFSRLQEIHERISLGKSRPLERFEEGIGLRKTLRMETAVLA
jgi:hypothetical protein